MDQQKASPGVNWVIGYQHAWISNDPDDISRLFTEDAVVEYDGGQIQGRSAIVADWLATADEPDDWIFEWRLLTDREDLAIVRAVTRYPKLSRTYDNLWEIHLAPDGRARAFTEWYMERGPASATQDASARLDPGTGSEAR